MKHRITIENWLYNVDREELLRELSFLQGELLLVIVYVLASLFLRLYAFFFLFSQSSFAI